ncbi:MAG: hypothetical protein V5B78_08295 [Desulfohalobiaceae bacterium]
MQKRALSTQILRQMGFELIELIIGVAIIAILASIAVSLYSQHRASAMNTAAQSELKTTKTSLEGHSVPQGDSYFNGGSPTEIDTLALDFESSDNVEIGYSGSNDTFEICAWHHNGDKYYSVNSSAKAISEDECSGSLCKGKGMFWLLFSQR